MSAVCVALAGADVVVVKSGRRICGSGACLANAPLHQNKSYFEFKVQSTGERARTLGQTTGTGIRHHHAMELVLRIRV